ncbi:MAG: hypothetical protein AAB448_01605 [Patescibacteria group bacterium]
MHKKSLVRVAMAIVLVAVIGAIGYVIMNNRSVAPAITSEATENWQFVDTNSFTLSLPPGWEFNALPGIDSYVGEFVGDEVTLGFDYGWYSNSLAEDGDTDYVITYEIIGGHSAKLVVPVVGGSGTTGVYFEDLGSNKMDRLQISGENLTTFQQDVALRIFRTLQFVEKDANQSPSFDFSFKYGVGAKNELDTFHDTFTKDMIVDAPIIISLKLTDEELNGIREKIEELNLFRPTEDSLTKVTMSTCADYDLLTQTFAVQQHIAWDGCEDGVNQDLESLETYIRSIIESKDAYKALPEPQGGYM